ncbi:MAG: PTS ascorbate transporter subunit IIB, partial [Methanothrix sp.]|nr:PTS ascorbate transporter subunit IIB [Methanothrix sp.]
MMATIIVSCANGAGSSLLLKMAVEKVTKELNM